VFSAAAIAAAVNVVADLLASRSELTTPPYLLLDHAAEPFRQMVELDRAAVLGAVSIAASIVNGLVAALFAEAAVGSRRFVALLGALLAGTWIVTGALLAVIYLDVPGVVLAGSLLAGLPRSFAVAWAIERLRGR
jgi:hypothetical protein